MSGDVRSSSPQNPKLKKTSKAPKQITEKVHLKEEQYLSNLLAKCFGQVEVALTLQPDRVSESNDFLLSRSLQTHHLLCETLERAEGQDSKVAKVEDDTQLKKEVKNSYKNVLRCSKDIHGASAKFKEGCDKDMGKVEQLFFDNFKAVIHSVLERGGQEEALLKVTPFQVPKSEASLDDRIASVTKRMNNIDTKIKDCKARIEELKTPIVPETPLTAEECQLYFNTPQQISLQNQLDQFTAQFNKLCLENTETERDIKEGTDLLEGEIEYTLQTFDEKMEVIQADVEVRQAELQRHDEEIESLDKLLAALKGDYDEVVVKREKADKLMREEKELLEAKTKAALIAQSWWRGFCVRKAMKNKDKKGKGKKGKGKKR